MYLELHAQQLTEDWFRLVLQVNGDRRASDRERLLASCLSDCGTVLNRLVVALNNATVVLDDAEAYRLFNTEEP